MNCQNTPSENHTPRRFRVNMQRLQEGRPAISVETVDGTVIAHVRGVMFPPNYDCGITQEGGHVFGYVTDQHGTTFREWEDN